MAIGLVLLSLMPAAAQNVEHCVDLADMYGGRAGAALQRADAKHCQAYVESISWGKKAVQQGRSCLAGSPPRAALLAQAVNDLEHALSASEAAATKDGCKF